MDISRVLVVTKRSAFELYSPSPDQKTREYALTSQRLKESHETQQRSIETVLSALSRRGVTYDALQRQELDERVKADAHFMANYGLVVVVGGDGTFLEASHYVDKTPILGVNSDPQNSVGYFSTANSKTIDAMIGQLDTLPSIQLHRLQIEKIGDGERVSLSKQVLNDILICNVVPADMVRYTMSVDGEQWRGSNGRFQLRSTGLLVCTAAGSTAWMYECGGKVMPLGSRRMQFHEREQRNSGFHFAERKIIVRSQTRGGIVYIDGGHLTEDFTLGSTIVITPGTPLTVLGDLRKKRKKK